MPLGKICSMLVSTGGTQCRVVKVLPLKRSEMQGLMPGFAFGDTRR